MTAEYELWDLISGQFVPDKVIVDKAQELGVNLVVIGNAARSGRSALGKSNTAEKVLRHMRTDVLAIKP